MVVSFEYKIKGQNDGRLLGNTSVPKPAKASPSPTLVAEPVLLPEAFMLGQKMPVACPPLGLHPVLELVYRKPANSDRLVLPRMTAPAFRRIVTMPSSAAGIVPRRAVEPLVACVLSNVTMLSLRRIGMPWRALGFEEGQPVASR